MRRCLVLQGFQAAKLIIFWRIFSIFSRCVDWGISSPLTVRLPEANSFQSHLPERGWKQSRNFLNSDQQPFQSHLPERGWKHWKLYFREGVIGVFPITSPRKGMETSNTSKENYQSFQSHLPERGWKLSLLPVHYFRIQDFPITSPRKGMETS